MPSHTIAIASAVVAAQELGWDYKFPYAENGTCHCEKVPALGRYFESEKGCLEAYAADKYQWCSFEGRGVFDSQCDEAVAVTEGVTNEDCSASCTSLVVGTMSLNEFQTTCKFNFYADFGDEVSIGWDSCFSNMVYGWSYYDPSNEVQAAPIKFLSDVEGPVQCQSLCQAVDDCVYWSWRAYPNKEGMDDANSFQNEPLTCLLFDKSYIDGVLNTVMPTSDAFATATPYCNFPEITECMIDPFGQDTVDLFNPYSCLLCDCVAKCVWQSPYHLSGPAFCEPEYRDECSYSRPVWSSTPAPSSTETTIALESTETTVELDSTETTVNLDSTEPFPTNTMGTSTPSHFTELSTSSVPFTGGTATTTATGKAPCPECDDCEDGCDEPEIYLDCEEPCDECMKE
eukprot:Gregarina_sp_Poly_1__10152@NODE_695_length_6720_cov_673_553735_g521_i1_p2_GENE_NODE_695_length_6720_cov_673_553735_g521_i1NODE_695_length_6720_cov_673_553735_g521_i1_p2_ORF_typecomplete_len400_score44_41PAN_4/PF14295_6/1_1e03PAN_4/PF14295_6/0_00061PAN_4/PF14295_6/1_8e04PAN_4/PF14295_6/1_8e04_NODE_695_length_6720_cov_673_553735_g521_i139325131